MPTRLLVLLLLFATTTACRARGTAPIAVPVSWSELKTIPSAGAFKLKDMASRLAQPDPWADYAKSAVQITKSVREKLGL